jgi:hypothetical protein
VPVTIGACLSAQTAAASVPPGWAPGGTPSHPTGQQTADKMHMPAYCGTNSVLLFRVRGSGEGYGSDRLGAWTANAGRALIDRGYNVRDMQAIYSAPAVPFSVKPTTWVHYRTVATREAPGVEGQLVRAYNRCKQRLILIAGYSQGSIVLREIVPHLSLALSRQIRRIDLIADPTEDKRSDGILSDRGPKPMRLTSEGLDTAAGRAIHNGHFRQTAYLKVVAGVTHQYCVPYDVVCDASGYNLTPGNLAGEGARHRSYPFAAIGTAAGNSLPSAATGFNWCGNHRDGFLLSDERFAVDGPIAIAMSHATAASIARRLGPTEDGTPETASQVPCETAFSVAQVAANAWLKWPANSGWAGVHTQGYGPGLYLGRFRCTGATLSGGRARETCQHVSDRYAGRIVAQFTIHPRS